MLSSSRGAVVANKVVRYWLGVRTWGYTGAIIDQVVGGVRGIGVADVGSGTASVVVFEVAQDMLTESSIFWSRWELSVWRRSETYPPVSAEQDRVAHGVFSDDVHPYRQGCGRLTTVGEKQKITVTRA